MKLLVTGANGFLGRYVVAEALRRGHAVTAVLRSTELPKVGWASHPNLRIVQADLRSRRGLTDAVAGMDAVLHLAAAKSGDLYAQYAGTVVATENLLAAMTEADTRRIVLVSSLSVYDYLKLRTFSLLTEESSLEKDAFQRDEYAHTKLVQERLVREHAMRAGWGFTILRPGVIYGKDNLFTARLGLQAGRFWIRTGAWARLPLTYVENCAEAIVLSAERDAARGQTLNVIDDAPPTQRRYANLLRKRLSPRPIIVPVAWTVMRFLAGLAVIANRLLLKNRAKIPGLFIPARLHARCKPLRFTNASIKGRLGWQPRFSLIEALDRSLGKNVAELTSVERTPTFRAKRTGAHRGGGGMNLRIAYMTGEYPRATDTFIQREVAALRQAGVHVQTLAVRKPPEDENVGPEQKAERKGTRYLLPACPWALFKTHINLLFRSPGRYLSALRTAIFVRPAGLKAMAWQVAYFAEAGLVAGHLRENQLTHLHNHFSNSSCSVAMLASELGGFTFSFTMHGPAEFFEPKYWRVDEKIRRALFVCCISHFCRSQAMIFAPQHKWNQLHIVHCGVDPRQFTQANHAGAGRRLLFVGRLAAVKGMPVLLQAMAQLTRQYPDVVLTVAGSGPDHAALKEQTKELGISEKVRFLGYQSQSQVRQLLGATDVFLMASFAEGVPVVLMEAMASAVPVVATRIAGIPELVEDGVSGFLVPPGDPQALAERTADLLSDPALRQRFGQAGRAQVEREFNISSESRRLVNLLTSALDGQPTPIRPEPLACESSAAAEVDLTATTRRAEITLQTGFSAA